MQNENILATKDDFELLSDRITALDNKITNLNNDLAFNRIVTTALIRIMLKRNIVSAQDLDSVIQHLSQGATFSTDPSKLITDSLY